MIRLRLITRLVLLSLLPAVLSFVVAAQEQPLRINYRLAMSHPSSHLFEVTIEVEMPQNVQPGSLDFQMAKWSPGRYAVFDFAKNVQEFRARGGICPRVNMTCTLPDFPVTRVDDQTWRVPMMNTHSATISYKVYGNDLSGTFSQLDARHANYNGGSIFMYVVNHKPDPVRLEIDAPKNWRIVNGRMDKPGQREWQFPNWDVMIDTPTEIAPDWTEDVFQVDGKTYHVIVHSFGNEGGKRPALVRDIEKIVRAEVSMWGPPEFDEYTVVLKGMLRVEHRHGTLDVAAGQAVITKKGEWVCYSTPGAEGAEYIAVCVPAFSPDSVHRDSRPDSREDPAH